MHANALAPLAGMLAACAIWGIWVHQALRGGTFRLGEEHGSSRWGSIEEGKAFMNQDEPDLNIPLTSSIGIPVSRSDFDLETDRNRNICVVGTPGTGKTRSHVLPLLMQMNASYLVTDPKGTLIESTGWMFEAAGYRIRNFDLVRMETSSHYNPLAYVRTDVDVLAIVECLITNTTGDAEHTGDPFWENAERLLYTALIAYLIHHCPPEDRNLPGMLTLLSLAEAREGNESYMSPLDLLFHELETGKRLVAAGDERPFDENSRAFTNGSSTVRWEQVREPADPSKDFALNAYKRFKTAAGETLKSIIISCNARLGKLDSAELREVLSDDDLGLEGMGDPGARVAIFATPSETKSTYNFLYAILAWQCVGRLCDRALVRYGGSLPTPVHLVLDEFCTIGKLPDIQTTIATVRSRNIGMTLVVQSLSQLTARYGEDAETIADCCDTTLFLGGKSTKTNKAISEQVGQQTVSTLSSTESRGPSGGSSRSYQHEARDLIQASEVGRMDRRMAILLVSGCDPVMDRKLSPESHPRAGELSRGALAGGGEGAGRMK